ncbi:MAG: caspase family protein [Saprospiraceae bacterium]|nr:caspase family protein [Saprospiraceae bacterium]
MARHRLFANLFLLVFGLSISGLATAQPIRRTADTTTPVDAPTMRAVVIGVSDYRDPGIRPLKYAHLDAQAFADYLRSDAAGKIQKQIRLLTNADATLASVDDAMNWLKTSSKEGDVALLYFAGHGDVELAALWQLGYLLTYDSPPNNYRNNAIRVEDLDLLAIELSSVRNVRTTFILDACRAGTLAEGRSVPTENLAKQKANEVRILSCKPDQKSAEGSTWGGGRGVFSYYLIRGLQGLANDESNTTDLDAVTVEELADYFRQTVVKDTKSLDPPQRQDPIIVSASETFPLGFVVPEIFTALTNEASSGDIVMADGTTDGRGKDNDVFTLTKVQAGSPIDLLLTTHQDKALIDDMDLPALLALPALEIPIAFITQLATAAQKQNVNPELQFNLNNYWQQADINVYDPATMKAFNLKLAIDLHDRGQEIINSYLRSDPDDLEERAFQKFETTKYRWYPDIFKLVLKLLPEGHPLRDRVAVKEAYFSGASVRILAIGLKDPAPAYAEAMALQQKALSLDPHAPYVHNELGILYKRTEQMKKAEYHFRKALELAPSWGLPYANLCATLILQNRLTEAQEYASRALQLMPDNYISHLHQGRIYELNRLFLEAEVEYLHCIRLAPEDFAAYDRLGYLYLQTGEYDKANANFEIINKLLDRFDFIAQQFNFPDVTAGPHKYPDAFGDKSVYTIPESLSTYPVGDPGPEYYMQLGEEASKKRQYAEALTAFQTVLQMDADTPQLYDHLAWTYLKLEKYELADRMLTLAERLTGYDEGRDMLKALLAEKWGRWSQAEKIYRDLLNHNPSFQLGYQKLGALYERTEQDVEAEMTYLEYRNYYKEAGRNALYTFYLRMSDKMPSQYSWKQRAGMILYQECITVPKSQPAMGHSSAEKVHGNAYDKSTTVDEFYSTWWSPLPYSIHPDLRVKQNACANALELFQSIYPYILSPFERASILQKTGNIHLQLNHVDQALSDFQRAFNHAPFREDIRDDMIQEYIAEQQYEKARKLLAQQDSLGRLHYPDHLVLVRMNNLNGYFQKAGEVMHTAKDMMMGPEESRSLDALEAQNAVLKGDLTHALTLYERNHTLHPDHGESAWSIARIHASQKHRKKALLWVDKAMKLGFRQYRWVVARDPAMVRLRNTSKWKRIIIE